MQRWFLASLALTLGMLVNVALDFYSAPTAQPLAEPAQESATTLDPSSNPAG